MKTMTKRLFLLLLALTLTLLCACSKQDPSAPAGMKALESEMDLDYILYVPEDWIQDKDTGIVSAFRGMGDTSNVSMTAATLSRDDFGLTAEAYFERYKADFEKTFADMTLDEGSPENMLLGGVAAMKVSFKAAVTDIPYHFMQVICIHNGTVYTFTYTAHESLYSQHLEDVDMMLQNFVFES